VIGILILAGVLFLLGRALGVFGGSSSTQVTIPNDLIGKDPTAASNELAGLNLKPVVQQQQSDAAQAGKVIDTTPKQGASVKKGSTVTLAVGAGPGQIAVPNLVGKPLTEAQNILTQANLQMSTTTQNSDTIPANQVISQDPPPGGQVAKGSTVNLVVSAGKAQVKVPDESGRDPIAAENDLRNLNLKFTTANEASDTVPAGAVTRTDPPAAAMVPTGSNVVIYISSGPPQVAVPNVVGQTQAQAQANLTAQGFKFTVTTATVNDPAQQGLVQAQSPSAGAKAGKGSTVAITVGQYQPPPTTSTSAPTSSSTAKP
jgi:serine/threonine-protein kinase